MAYWSSISLTGFIYVAAEKNFFFCKILHKLLINLVI